MNKQAVFLGCLLLTSCQAQAPPPSSQAPTDLIEVLQSSEKPNEILSAAAQVKKTSAAMAEEGRKVLLKRSANTADPGLAQLLRVAYFRTYDLVPEQDWSVYEHLSAIAKAVNFGMVCEETLAVELKMHKGPKLLGAVSTDQLLQFLSDSSMPHPWAFIYRLEKNQLVINLRPVGRPK